MIKLSEQQIKKILLSENYVSEENVKKAEAAAKAGRQSIVEYLLAEQLLTKDLLGQAVADFYKVSYSDLNSIRPAAEQILKLPEETAKKFRAVLFKEDEKSATITTDNPGQKELPAELENIFKNKEIKITYSLPEDIDDIFIQYRKPLETRFAKIIKEQKRVAPEIIEEILKDADVFRASDIHFEPQDKEIIIRFRIDGVLHEVCRLSKENYEGILNRVKVQAHMRIDEHFSAQ
ncbi:MAG: ATPase, T2SS/T4P/T4SS family, partial [Patescibacteria group bacterium]